MISQPNPEQLIQEKYNVDIVIESTKYFEQELSQLPELEKAETVKIINACVAQFPNCQLVDSQLVDSHGTSNPLSRLNLTENLNGYESSLYVLRVTNTLGVVLAVDEDPIFNQIIFTLFRVVPSELLPQAYGEVANTLYQQLHPEPDLALVS
jgi:hypothetical protein